MDIYTKTYRKNNVCFARLDLFFTTDEQKLIEDFGDPVVDTGGVFPNFTLPNSLDKLKGNSPFIKKFDAGDYGEALAKSYAEECITELEDRFTVAIQNLRSKKDDFTKEVKKTV